MIFGQDKAPSYDDATKDTKVPEIDQATRRSMEDEESPLPEGWVRQWDPKSQHHFYVDTKANPPRAIWNHPYEDREWLEAHGHELSDSESEAGEHHPSRTPDAGPSDSKDRSTGSPTTPGPSYNQPADQSRGMFGGSNVAYNQVPGPQDMNFQTHGRKGIIGGAISLIFGDNRYRQRQQDEMQYRYMQRRAMFNQGGVDMAGPMYGGNPMMYAAPAMPFSRFGERRMERAYRRDMRFQGRAARRGYGVPVLQPEFAGAPLYEYGRY